MILFGFGSAGFASEEPTWRCDVVNRAGYAELPAT